MLDACASEILGFVIARRHKNGGFAAAPTLPPSMEDTYYALSILKLILPHSKETIEAIQKESKLSSYLEKAEGKETWKARTLYHYLCSCQFAGVAKAGDPFWLKSFLKRHLKATLEISEWYYGSRIAREHMEQPLIAQEEDLFEKVYPKWRTVRELWMLLYIANGSPERLSTTKKKLVTWVQACQNPDGGFGYLPGTTSFIENAHFSMRILTLLGAKPLSTENLREFIMRCKTGRGGFSRRSGAAAFLDTTWHAVKVLDLLEKPRTQSPAHQESVSQLAEDTKEKERVF